jgi:hypothetical protein
MRAHGAVLGHPGFFVPIDGPIRAAVHQRFFAFGFFHVDQNDAVVPAADTIWVRGDAGSVFAVLARHGKIGYVDSRVLAAFFSLNIHPAVSVPGLGFRIGRPIIHDMFVFAGVKQLLQSWQSATSITR